MVQSHRIRFASAAILIPFTVALAQEPTPPASKLEMPFSIKREEFKTGNPLAVYAEQVKREKDYVADDMWRSTYWQARGTIAAYIGDIYEANKCWNSSYPRGANQQVMLKSPLEGYHPEDAVGAIVKAADKHNWIMVGEEHLQPQTRSILVSLLQELYKKGFRTFAAETFNDDVVAQIAKDGFPTYDTGTYTADPVFSAGVREAIRLGYKVVPYEGTERPKEIPKDDPQFLQNFRENLQAKHLKERIFDKDPKAKVLVWAGRAHVLERSDKDSSGSEWRPMAHEFKRMTGVDPYSVYLATYVEQSERKFEWSTYKWAVDRGLVKRPTIFFDRSGKAYGEEFDAQVFFPRTVIVEGRPDWLRREMDRKIVAIPPSLVKPSGFQLVQAFPIGQPVTAIPIDQMLIRPGDPVPALMLPRGKFWVRVVDAEGKENGRAEVAG